MTLPAALPRSAPSRFGWRDLGLWSGAAALVLGAHVAVAYAVQDFSMANEADGGPPPAQTIDVMPMVVMPAVEEQVAALDALTPDQTEPTPATETTPEEPADKTVPVVDRPDTVPPDETEPSRTEAAEQADPPDALAPDETDPARTDVVREVDQPPLDEAVPDIVQAIAPEVIIPVPRPKPVEIAKAEKSRRATRRKSLSTSPSHGRGRRRPRHPGLSPSPAPMRRPPPGQRRRNPRNRGRDPRRRQVEIASNFLDQPAQALSERRESPPVEGTVTVAFNVDLSVTSPPFASPGRPEMRISIAALSTC